MGSSGDPKNSINTRAIDASVGALVWVQRRNGSWWPGQIMGLDEISEDTLASPRLGTPVKLLGRQDATIDWYNIEKSKRVKGFRCGEYDEFIEKARASAANGYKRAVKYARREDAILHALEIENARLRKDCLAFSKNDSGNEHRFAAKDSSIMSLSGKGETAITDIEHVPDGYKDDSGSVSASHSDSEAARELSQSGVSFQEPNHVGPSKVICMEGKSRRTPNDSEDDGTEGMKRMRGLEDLGMGVRDSNIGNCMSNGTLINGSKVHSSTLKRKRTQMVNVHEFLKRKNRRRPLTKVLESTAMVSVPVICDQLPVTSCSSLQVASDFKVSGVGSNESRKGSTALINNNSDFNGVSCENGSSLNTAENAHDALYVNEKLEEENDVSGVLGPTENGSSDRLFDVPFVGEEKQSAGLSSLFVPSSTMHQMWGSGRQSDPSSGQAEAAPFRNGKLKDFDSNVSAAAYINCNNRRMEKGTSKWQSKGKRNSRHKSRNRKRDLRKYAHLDDKASAHSESKGCSNGVLLGFNQSVGSDDGGSSPTTTYNCKSPMKSKLLANDQVDAASNCSNSITQNEPHVKGSTEEMSFAPQRSLPYRESRFVVNSRYQSSYFLDRKYYTHSRLHDVMVEVNANYRRQHVPLVSLMSKLNGKAIVGHPLTVGLLNDGQCDAMISSNEIDAAQVASSQTAHLDSTVEPTLEAGRMSSKNTAVRPRHSSRKSAKQKRSGLLSKKIRKLSSLTASREHKKPVDEKPKGPVMACIPVKLVFSRIREAVNGSLPARIAPPHQPTHSSRFLRPSTNPQDFFLQPVSEVPSLHV